MVSFFFLSINKMNTVKHGTGDEGLQDRQCKVHLSWLSIFIAILLTILTFCSCTVQDNPKMSSLLQTQVKLKIEQLARPTDERLQLMENMGIRTDHLEDQRVFIHMKEEPTESQISQFESLGVMLYLDSWIPALEDHPTGFLLADIPLYSLDPVTRLDYVIMLETAERALEPHDGSQPQA